MSDTPLLSAVSSYIAKDFARFHMPGHKGKAVFAFADAAYDVTEVEGTDSLYAPTEAILELEQGFAQLYGTERSMLSAGGSTLCIQAMLALIAKEGGTLIAGRNIHVAGVNTMALLGLSPHWVYPRRTDSEPLIGRISPDDVEEALRLCPHALGVYITSPDYFGVISDIGGIAEVCKSHGVPLLVDNAHGAHLAFVQPTLHPIHLGADLCCDSLHKTLPVLTGGALLHTSRTDFASRGKGAMSLFGSTSPSYLVMLSADACLGELRGSLPQAIADTCDAVSGLKELALSCGFVLPTGTTDPMRLTLCLAASGIQSSDFYAHLKEHGVMPEFISENGCVFLLSPYNYTEEWTRLQTAIATANTGEPLPLAYRLPHPVKAMPLRAALLGEKEELPISRCVGRIAAQVKSPCPPGIPLVMPGEMISEEDCKLLEGYGVERLEVVCSTER